MRRPGRRLTVGFSAMANTQDRHLMRHIVEVVDDPVVALAHTVHILRVRQFLYAMWARTTAKMQNLFVRASQIGFGKASEFFASRREAHALPIRLQGREVVRAQVAH